MEAEAPLVQAPHALVVSTPVPPSPVLRVCLAEVAYTRFLSYVPFAAIAMTITMAAKVELFTYLACLANRPVVSPDQGANVVSLLARQVSVAFDGGWSSGSGGNALELCAC